MKLSISNCGGVRLVPYGAGSPVVYGWGSFEQTASVGDRTMRVHVEFPWVDKKRSMIMPGFSESGKPILDISGMVYIPDVSILVNPNSGTFTHGGYLGTKTIEFKYTVQQSGTSGSSTGTIRMDVLGVINAPYRGGVIIDGLNITNDTLTTVSGGSKQPHRWNSATAFSTDQSDADFYNNGTTSNSRGWEWFVPCAVGYDFGYEVI